MKLNSDIIYDFLSRQVPLTHYGQHQNALMLQRPLLFSDTIHEFVSNQLYVAYSVQLPQTPVLQEDVVLVCVGGPPPAIYLTSTCSCLVVLDDTDIFTVFNYLQKLYNRFDVWEASLTNIINTTANISELLEVSYPILENPMVVIGADYHYLGYSSIIDKREDLAVYRPDSNNKFQPEKLALSIHMGDTNMSMTQPFYMEFDGNVHYSINLFHKGVYTGNLKVAFVFRPYRESDNILVQYLAHCIEKAIPKLVDITYRDTEVLRGAVSSLLRGTPLSSAQRQVLSVNSPQSSYLCLKLIRGERSKKKVPIAYFCHHIENTFPGSIALEHNSSIIAILRIHTLPFTKEELYQKICDILQEMNLKAGISNTFLDISRLHLCYRQACIALEMGSPLYPERNAYFFNDYALRYMMYSCMGEFPLEMLYSEGFRQLLEYNQDAQVDYLETLQVYLNNNLNIAQSAKALFIHRSTFLERLKRIESLLHTELKDPEQRLCLNIILKIREMRQLEKVKQTEIRSSNFESGHYDYHELDKLF